MTDDKLVAHPSKEWIAYKGEGAHTGWNISTDEPSRPPIAYVGGMDTPWAKKNAYLIAAAPEMHAALLSFPDPPDDIHCSDGLQAYVEAIEIWRRAVMEGALAKAAGRKRRRTRNSK